MRTADITVALTFPDGTPDAAEKMVSGSRFMSYQSDSYASPLLLLR